MIPPKPRPVDAPPVPPVNPPTLGDQEPENVDRGHEPEDTRVRGVLLVGLGLFVSLLVIYVGMGVYGGLMDRARPRPERTIYTRDVLSRRTSTVPPVDTLRIQREALEREQRARLSGSGPVPGTPGRVRIPVEEAMREAAARGLPEFPAPAARAVPAAPDARGSRGPAAPTAPGARGSRGPAIPVERRITP